MCYSQKSTSPLILLLENLAIAFSLVNKVPLGKQEEQEVKGPRRHHATEVLVSQVKRATETTNCSVVTRGWPQSVAAGQARPLGSILPRFSPQPAAGS
jgi:hypothetical protein